MMPPPFLRLALPLSAFGLLAACKKDARPPESVATTTISGKSDSQTIAPPSANAIPAPASSATTTEASSPLPSGYFTDNGAMQAHHQRLLIKDDQTMKFVLFEGDQPVGGTDLGTWSLSGPDLLEVAQMDEPSGQEHTVFWSILDSDHIKDPRGTVWTRVKMPGLAP